MRTDADVNDVDRGRCQMQTDRQHRPLSASMMMADSEAEAEATTNIAMITAFRI